MTKNTKQIRERVRKLIEEAAPSVVDQKYQRQKRVRVNKISRARKKFQDKRIAEFLPELPPVGKRITDTKE